MYSPSGKSELQARYQESLAKFPPTERRSPREQGFALTGKKAAVGLVVAEVAGSGELVFLLTKRATHLNSHAGQISLPGGMHEEQSDANLVETLSREISEEVGICVDDVEWVTNSWDEVVSKHGVLVFPFLGFLKKPLINSSHVSIDPNEVEFAEWLPLRQLFDGTLWTERSYQIAPGLPSFKMPIWTGWREETWGLTAVILRLFVSRISGDRPY